MPLVLTGCSGVSVILGDSGESVVTGNPAAKALKMAKALGA